ncbi:MAG: hypothetical protein KDJ27_16815 [Gammaproteobacteria bacterium]|nr:hypothetical protein [Gammaproteobacteria bacterium]
MLNVTTERKHRYCGLFRPSVREVVHGRNARAWVSHSPCCERAERVRRQVPYSGCVQRLFGYAELQGSVEIELDVQFAARSILLGKKRPKRNPLICFASRRCTMASPGGSRHA